MQNPARTRTPIVGEAPAFLTMLEQVSHAAHMSKPVLVIGERGTGKELIAERLHYLSERWGQPLVKLNCSALTESLLDSELFGHEAGAFTGAGRQHVGRFERADQGTLMLDELATIGARMQEKILRVIEYGTFERVGGTETIEVDVRIVGATNADLPALAARGEFRADLLDRLAFDVIHVPPLRERLEDILPLAEHFAVNVTAELQRAFFPGFSAQAKRMLLRHHWPGNVRDLKNVVERSVYRAVDPEAPLEDIILNPFAGSFTESRVPTETKAEAPEPPEPPEPPATTDYNRPFDLRERVRAMEVEAIAAALAQCRYNQRRTAEHLGLSYHQLRGYLRKYELGRNPRDANG